MVEGTKQEETVSDSEVPVNAPPKKEAPPSEDNADDEKKEEEDDSNEEKDEESKEVNEEEEKRKKEEEEALREKYKDWPMKNISEVHDNDVLYGRGGKSFLTSSSLHMTRL